MDELLVVVGDEVEPAGVAVLELRQQQLRDLARKSEIVGAEIGLHHLDQRVEQESMVVEVGAEVSDAILVGGEQPITRLARSARKLARNRARRLAGDRARPPEGGADE